jgi:hypothetical protein
VILLSFIVSLSFRKATPLFSLFNIIVAPQTRKKAAVAKMPGQQDLIAALQAVAAGMIGQQKEKQQQLQQQQDLQQEQQDAFQAALIDQQAHLQARLAAQQQAQLQVNQDRLRTAATSTIQIFSGRPEESLEEWLAVVNRVAAAENWDDANKRRVAVSKLSGIAAQWHDQTGHALVGWNAWQLQLRAMFEPRMSLTEWCLLVESRRQQPGEDGAQYALEKARLCRRCPVAMAEAEFVPYLIRGLSHSEHVSALLSAPPNTVAGFIDTIRRLEVVSGLGMSTLPSSLLPPPSPVASVADIVTSLGEQIKQAVALQMEEAVGHMEDRIQAALPRPTFIPPKSVSFNPNSPVSTSAGPQFGNVECYYCHGFGHIARDCPHRSSGNAQAGFQPGQGQQ